MLRLRPYKKCDAKYIVSWIKDEISFRKWCADRYESYYGRTVEVLGIGNEQEISCGRIK